MKPCAAEGRYCIDLTDPVTGKVTERIAGKNHVFEESLFSSWPSSVSTVCLALNDSTTEIDSNMPFLFGQNVGYGLPSTSGTGNYRGAFNSANQVLAKMTPDSVRWKFQYDFTTAQANGTIGTIGLTYQYLRDSKSPMKGFYPQAVSTGYSTYTSDGRYSYNCTTAGIITRYDNYMGLYTLFDVSAIVGTNSATAKAVGYASATGLYYIYAYNSTASLRKMYVFTDNTFTTLSATYSPSNVAPSTGLPMYVYGNYAFWTSNNIIYVADFVNNTAYTTTTVTSYSRISAIENSTYYDYPRTFHYGSMAYGKYIICYDSYDNYKSGIIYDMSSQSVIGHLTNPGTPSYATIAYPHTSSFLPVTASQPCKHNCAIAAKKLDNSVTKTSANGMTVTYELEVFWE